MIALAFVALVAACETDTTPTASPTASPKSSVQQPSTTPTATVTVAPTGTPFPVTTPTAAGAATPDPGLYARQQCQVENTAVARTGLPRRILVIEPQLVSDGQTLTISGDGYRPNVGVEVRIFLPGTNRVSQPLAQLNSNGAGLVAGVFTVPSLRMLNAEGDTSVPESIGVSLWSPSEQAGASVLVSIP